MNLTIALSIPGVRPQTGPLVRMRPRQADRLFRLRFPHPQVVHFEWSRLLNTSARAPFVTCAEGGRAGVLEMLAPFSGLSVLPISAVSGLTCYLIHDRPQASRWLKQRRKAPVLRCLMVHRAHLPAQVEPPIHS